MNEFEVVSVDMFQTLVDVNSRRYEVFKSILGDLYTEGLADECWNAANSILSRCIKKYIEQDEFFYPVRKVFKSCYQELFPMKGINFDPVNGAKILAYEHGKSDLFEDTETFLYNVQKKYPICLVSDTDNDMVQPILEKLEFDEVFLSEELKCYKNSSYKSMFTYVLSHYKVNPQQIIHIGDSYADIAGAKGLGITACWLNRYNKEWKYDIKPDYIVTSLNDVAEIIGIEHVNII
jgi:putative hydrolase of the HAD superfamily